MEPIPPEALLETYPGPIRELAEELRAVVRATVPDVRERVRPGWRLIGYDAPAGGRLAYFAYVAPEQAHVHLGFEHGVLMHDPGGHLLGAGITRRVRWLTWRPGEPIDRELVGELVQEGLRVARLSPAERFAAGAEQDDSGRPDSHPGLRVPGTGRG
jgi:hypothetical protein